MGIRWLFCLIIFFFTKPIPGSGITNNKQQSNPNDESVSTWKEQMGISNSVPVVAATAQTEQTRKNSNRSLNRDNDDESQTSPLLGLKLSCFHLFVEECGGVEFLDGLTTEMVCARFVKPVTAHAQESYCELLQTQCHPAVSEPTACAVTGFTNLAQTISVVRPSKNSTPPHSSTNR